VVGVWCMEWSAVWLLYEYSTPFHGQLLFALSIVGLQKVPEASTAVFVDIALEIR
jgi:hypothetical protein